MTRPVFDEGLQRSGSGQPVATIGTDDNGVFKFTESLATNFLWRFYRVTGP